MKNELANFFVQFAQNFWNFILCLISLVCLISPALIIILFIVGVVIGNKIIMVISIPLFIVSCVLSYTIANYEEYDEDEDDDEEEEE